MKSVIAAFVDSGAAHRANAELGAQGIQHQSIRMIEEGRDASGVMRVLIEHDVPRERAEQYAEGVRRGAVLVVVDADDEAAPRIAQILDTQGSIDFQTAAARWRTGGWTGYQEGAGMLGDDERRLELAELEREQVYQRENPAGQREHPEGQRENLAADLGEQRGDLDVIEEDVRIGKREVARGGVRVRTFVTERPVREALELREERIEVSREPTDEPLPATEADFTEQEFVVTATGEEPVVEKRARVVEHVRVDKDVETHTETIEETERKREVEVERLDPDAPGARRH